MVLRHVQAVATTGFCLVFFFFFFFFPNLLDHRQKHHQTSGKTLSIQLSIFSSLTSTSIEIYAYFGFLSFFYFFIF